MESLESGGREGARELATEHVSLPQSTTTTTQHDAIMCCADRVSTPCRRGAGKLNQCPQREVLARHRVRPKPSSCAAIVITILAAAKVSYLLLVGRQLREPAHCTHHRDFGEDETPHHEPPCGTHAQRTRSAHARCFTGAQDAVAPSDSAPTTSSKAATTGVLADITAVVHKGCVNERGRSELTAKSAPGRASEIPHPHARGLLSLLVRCPGRLPHGFRVRTSGLQESTGRSRRRNGAPAGGAAK